MEVLLSILSLSTSEKVREAGNTCGVTSLRHRQWWVCCDRQLTFGDLVMWSHIRPLTCSCDVTFDTWPGCVISRLTFDLLSNDSRSPSSIEWRPTQRPPLTVWEGSIEYSPSKRNTQKHVCWNVHCALDQIGAWIPSPKLTSYDTIILWFISVYLSTQI